MTIIYIYMYNNDNIMIYTSYIHTQMRYLGVPGPQHRPWCRPDRCSGHGEVGFSKNRVGYRVTPKVWPCEMEWDQN